MTRMAQLAGIANGPGNFSEATMKLVFLASDWTEEQINAVLDNLTEDEICNGFSIANTDKINRVVTDPYGPMSSGTYGRNSKT